MLLDFLREHAALLQQKTLEHIVLSSVSLIFASIIAIPLGIGAARFPLLQKSILPVGSISQTIPSLAMLGFLVPILGLGTRPTILVLTFYALYPILKSTYTGIKSVPAECIEAAQGLGFSSFQKLWFVELPLALPIIVSGVRVATAMTIGIASIAALIGAGGLGDFIMQGLALNNTSLILLGAIPAAFLALTFDYLISQLERGLQDRKHKAPRTLNFQKSFLFTFGCLAFLGMSLFFYANIINKKENLIVIASKNFTESFILAEMMAQLIENKTSLKVSRKFNLGTTDILHQGMLNNEIDIYPEYTGTAYLTVLKQTPAPKKGSLFQEVQAAYKNKFNLIWLDPFGFSNSQILAIPVEYAKHHHMSSLSDLARVAHTFTIAAPPEFLKRPDALPGLVRTYGLKFKNIQQVDPNLIYLAIQNKAVEVIAAFSTDGKLKAYNLVPLFDDKYFYPSYEAAPVVRQSVLKDHPEVYLALSVLFGRITPETMIYLNYQVDIEGRSPAEVARLFLSKI